MIYDRAPAMMRYVGPYYSRSRIYQAQNEAKAAEINMLRAMIDETADQIFVETATWGLERWEDLCNLQPSPGDSIDFRRRKVIVWLQMLSPVTPRVMERLCQTVTHCPVHVTENVAPYVFRVDCDVVVPFSFRDLYAVIEEAKPAHLALEGVTASYTGEIKTFVGAAATWLSSNEAELRLPFETNQRAWLGTHTGVSAQVTQSSEAALRLPYNVHQESRTQATAYWFTQETQSYEAEVIF